jgi:ferredoxin
MAERIVKLANRNGEELTVDDAENLLDALLDHGVDLPYGCLYGGCITCAARLTEGEVDQERQVALNDRQLREGYVTLCVAKPLTDCTLEVGVDSHDRLYQNPFLTGGTR